MRSTKTHLRLAVLFAIGIMLASLVHLHFMNDMPEINGLPPINSDLLPRWVGIRAAWRGEDPYSPGVLREIQTAYYGHPLTLADQSLDPQGFWYPAYTAIVLGPFALLPWNAARLAFPVVALILLMAGVYFCIRALKKPNQVVWIATPLILVSWPVIWGLQQQQPTVLTAAFVFLAYFLIVRGDDIPAGALLAASMIKPQLVVPLILWLFLWAVLQRRYRLLVSFACTMAALLIPTEILIPNWFPHWIHSAATYSHAGRDAPPLVAALGNVAGPPATAILVSLSAFVLWRLRFTGSESPQFGLAFSIALAIAVCVTPRSPGTIYNQMLLAPAAVVVACWKPASLLSRAARIAAIVLFARSFLAELLAVAGESILGQDNLWMPFQNRLLPVVVTIALLAQYWDVPQTTSSAHRDEFATDAG